MVSSWLATNNLFLLLCASMYQRAGWSLVLFPLPIASKFRPDNCYNKFVPQVTTATRLFTGQPQDGGWNQDPRAELDVILRCWMVRNRVQARLWTMQWAAMACWSGLEVTR